MKYVQMSCEEFTNETFSKAAVPGGGGVAALVGALGTALAGMVGNLTAGKKKYAEYEEDIQRILAEAEKLKSDLLGMIDQDAENFLPLSKAYGLPQETEEEKKIKKETMQAALKVACEGPIDIVRASYKAIELHDELALKGSALALSDVGVGVQLLSAALVSGWLNVLININMIEDAEYVSEIREELEPLVESGRIRCEEICSRVIKALDK